MDARGLLVGVHLPGDIRREVAEELAYDRGCHLTVERFRKSAGKAGDDHVFRGNADVPLCIVNLVLDKYGLEIEEDG